MVYGHFYLFGGYRILVLLPEFHTRVPQTEIWHIIEDSSQGQKKGSGKEEDEDKEDKNKERKKRKKKRRGGGGRVGG